MNTVLHLKNRISFEEFITWLESCRLKGERLVDKALRNAAMTKRVAILANPTKPVSFAHFIRPDVQSKECKVRERTLQEGVGKGFLSPIKFFSERELTFTIENELFYATDKGYFSVPDKNLI